MLKKYTQFFLLTLSLVLLTGFMCCCKKDKEACSNNSCATSADNEILVIEGNGDRSEDLIALEIEDDTTEDK